MNEQISYFNTYKNWLGLVILLVLSSALVFYDLGGTMLAEDEAHYALATDDLVQHGQWMTPKPVRPHAYFQKPPLYFWLSGLTYAWFDEPVRYRVWSALAGVGCCVLTYVLGLRLLGWVGALAAGLLLCTHMRWLLIHGARDGTMDTMLGLMFLVGLYAARYWTAKPWRSMATYALISAVGSLLKPGFGWVLLFGPLVAVAIQGGGWRGVKLILLGGCLGWLAASPWYVVQTLEHGSAFWRDVLGVGLARRVSAGAGSDVLFYFKRLADSSPHFWLAGPAVAVCAWQSIRTPRQTGDVDLGVWSCAAGCWLVVLSAFGGKNAHYAFLVLPLVCLCMVGALAWVLNRVMPMLAWEKSIRVAGLMCLVIGAAWVPYRLAVSIPQRNILFGPETLWQQNLSTHKLIFAGIGPDQVSWRTQDGLNATDCYYLKKLWPNGQAMTLHEAKGKLIAKERVLLILPAGQKINGIKPLWSNQRLAAYANP